MNELVSVVIPVYNVEQYLEECINSVINQTYSALEIILVDDGSTDSSGEICDKYKKYDNRIQVIHRENGGLSAARNTGMDTATGKYLYFLDSDDYIEAITIEHLVAVSKEEMADMVFFDAYVFFTDCEYDESLAVYSRKSQYKTARGREVIDALMKNDEYRTPVQLYFYKTSWLLEHNLRFYEGIIHEDELFTFMAFSMDGVVAHCHEELYARRIRPSSIMTSSSIERRFVSIMVFYNELAKMYQNENATWKPLIIHITGAAKYIVSKYQLLSVEQQEKYAQEFKEFKKSVLRYKGFGDMKLKIKCSGLIMNKFYRGINKFQK